MDAAERAVSRAGDAVTNMAYVATQDGRLSEVCLPGRDDVAH